MTSGCSEVRVLKQGRREGSQAVGTLAPQPTGRRLTAGLVLRVARYPLQALFVMAVPPILGADAYGVFATCVSAWAVVSMATDFGVDAIFGRLVPGLEAPAASRVLRQVLWLRLALAGGPGALLLGLLWTPRHEDPMLFLLVLSAVLAVPLQQVVFARLYSKGRLLCYIGRDPLRSALSLLLVLPGYLVAGVVGAVAAIGVAQVLLAIVGAAWLRPTLLDLAPPDRLSGLRGLLRFGLAAVLPPVLIGITLKLGTVLLSRIGRPSVEVGAFDLAVNLLALVMTLAAYPFTALMPDLGRSFDSGGMAEVRGPVRLVIRRSAAAAIVIVVSLVTVGQPLLTAALGREFAGVFPLTLLLVGVGIFPILVTHAGLGLAVLARRPACAIWPSLLLLLLVAAGILWIAPSRGSTGAGAVLLGGLMLQAILTLVAVPGLASLVWRPLAVAVAVSVPALVLAAADVWGTGGIAPAARSVALLVAAAGSLIAAFVLAAPGLRRCRGM